MLANFQLTAIAKMGVFRVPLLGELQEALSSDWHEQLEAFYLAADQIDFDPGYHLEDDQLFRIQNYELPDWLADINSQTVDYLDAIHLDDNLLETIKSVAAFTRYKQKEIVLFQHFARSRIIRPGRTLILSKNTYRTMTKPGLSLDTRLCGAYQPEAKTLLFKDFRKVNTFLNLTDFYQEASEKEIREVLNHDLFEAEDADALAENANQWFRKRFAMLRDSEVLEQYTAKQITDHAQNYEVTIERKGGKIVFPAEKRAAKRLLQFLNEEIFRGAITEKIYETNSKREAE